MTQARRPAGTPVGGQFAPTNRPEATGVELVDDDPVSSRRVVATVATGIPSFSIEGVRDRGCRETRDRVRAALLSSDLSWPMDTITVRVNDPSPARTADLDLEIALGILQASGQLPDADVGGLRGELGLDGSIRGESTTDARSLRELVDSLKAGSNDAAVQREPVQLSLFDASGYDEPAEQATTARVSSGPTTGDQNLSEIVFETTQAAETVQDPATAETEKADRSWRLFRESYGAWLDGYRKSRYIGGMGETERRLREAAGLAGVDAAQLRADKARAYRGETSEQILKGR